MDRPHGARAHRLREIHGGVRGISRTRRRTDRPRHRLAQTTRPVRQYRDLSPVGQRRRTGGRDARRICAALRRSTTVHQMRERLDDLGTEKTQPLYPRSWAMASDTPFKYYKLWPYAGGVQTSFIVSWPGDSIPRDTEAIHRHDRHHAHGLDITRIPAPDISRASARSRSRASRSARPSIIPRAPTRATPSTTSSGAAAASGTTAGKPSASTHPAPTSTATAGSCTMSKVTSASPWTWRRSIPPNSTS